MSKLINLSEEKSKKEKKKLIMTIIFAITIIYIMYAIYLILRTPTDTVTVENGALTLEESSTGYIIRNEVVVQGQNYKNGIFPIVSEGERAAKKQTIFRYYGKGEDEVQQKISDIELKIQEALEKEKMLFPTDVKNLETQIDEKIKDIKGKSDVHTINEYKKQISDIMMKKATIAGENSKSGSYIKKLVKERDELQKKLINASEYVVAPNSGVVSYRVDGYENILTANDFENITADKLDELDIKTGKIISSSDESAKIIDNFGCYIATVLNSDIANAAKVGQNVKITLSSGNEIPAEICFTKTQENGDNLIVFKLNTLTEELISYRKISFNITWWNVSGIKVPNSAILQDENGSKYVMKKTASDKVKCLIKILKSNDKYSIIGSYTTEDLQVLNIDISTYNTIKIYDTIMLHPEK